MLAIPGAARRSRVHSQSTFSLETLEDRFAMAAFTPGNLVAVVVGDGVTTANGVDVALREYTPSGTLVQTIPMPTSTSGGQLQFRMGVNSTSEGMLNRSPDGKWLALAGYDVALGGSTVGVTSPPGRVLGRVNWDGVTDTSTSSNTVYTGSSGAIRAAITDDGNRFWTAGTAGSGTSAYVRHFANLGSGTNVNLTSGTVNSINTRNVYIGFDNRLYFATSAGATQGIYSFATALPTSASAETVAITSGSTAGLGGMLLVDMDQNGSLSNGDRFYYAHDGLGIRRSVYNGASWDASTTVNTTSGDGLRGLTGVRVSASSVQLYGTTFTSRTTVSNLVSFLDDGVNTSFTTLTTLAANGNFGFRGLTFAPANPPPTVSSIVRASANPTMLSSIDFTVTFSEAVTGVDLDDFSVVASGVTGATVSNVAGLGTTYTVTVSTGSGSGSLQLNLTDDDSIVDVDGIKLGGAGAANGNFTGPSFTVDKLAPTLTITPNGTTTTSSPILFTFAFTEAVTGFDASDVAISNGSAGTFTPLAGGMSYTLEVTPTTSNVTVQVVVAGGAAQDAAGNLSGAGSASVQYSNDLVPPTVQGVFVSGSAWDPSFLSYLAAQNLGTASEGYAIPAASQLSILPWNNVNKISILFSENVLVTQNDLRVFGVNTPTATVSGFAYNPTTFVATWTLAAPIVNDKIRLWLDSGASAVRDAGGIPLDGEWANLGDGADTFPSGDGFSGGVFRFRFNILPGDVDRSGIVNTFDVTSVYQTFNITTAAGAYTIFRDVNGSGTIDVTDANIVRSRRGIGIKDLPSSDPATDPASIVSAGVHYITGLNSVNTSPPMTFVSGSTLSVTVSANPAIAWVVPDRSHFRSAAGLTTAGLDEFFATFGR